MVRGLLSVLPLFATSAVAFPTAFGEETFDYIIVGGGTSGLVVANRLSELSNVTVAVIEAGDSVFNNPNVTNIDGFGLALGTQIDWAYPSTQQTFADGNPTTLRAGKALGGSSAINGMIYARAQNVQIDSWGLLGNEGWSWDELLPYYRKSEQLQLPDEAQRAIGVTYEPAVHGNTGPLNVGWQNDMYNRSFTDVLNETHRAVGVPYNQDLASGSMVGWGFLEYTINHADNAREDAARAYYWPFANRTNYHVFLNTEAQKLVWDYASTPDAKATGVVVKDARTGAQRTIRATREIILSTGAVRTPVLLELSGVGNPAILEQAGIDVKVDLPTVGENLQDQAYSSFAGRAAGNFTGRPGYVVFLDYEQVYGQEVGAAVAAETQARLAEYAATVSNSTGGVVPPEHLEKFFQIQYDHIFKDRIPVGESMILPSDGEFASGHWGLLPFARGNVHVTGSSGEYPAALNPNYFGLEFDTQLQANVTKYLRTFHNAEPLRELFAEEISPGLEAVPADAGDAVWQDWARQNYRSNFHSVGTTAMLPKDLGGVVDSKLRVYGTSNVRVVDAGVIPLQICGHMVGTLYAIAEKAADIIKSDA